jgi:hypothetical protein
MEKVQYIMIDRQSKKPGRSGERGAALVVAIAIMTILLAVGLTFYAISRQEVTNAVNVRNQVQVDLLLDATHAIAQAELNRDFIKNPNATSLDAAPFTLFNGSWAVGKQWARRNGTPLQWDRDLIDNDGDGFFDKADPDEIGVPLVDLSAMPFIDFGGGNVEQMFSGNRSRGWLTIPRFEGANPVAYESVLDDSTGLLYPYLFNLSDRTRPPFVTPAFYGPGFGDANNDGNYGLEGERYPLEWIHTWTDVDNDGDDLNDAIWIPLPQDKFFSGGEVVDDATGRRMYDDGIDNDLDGIVDNEPEAGEGEMELGVFVYWGGDDGLDNDGDGAVDEGGNYAGGGEQDYFLTAPLTGITVYLDFNADGKVPDLVPNAAGALEKIRVEIAPADIVVETASGPVTLPAANNNHVDRIDNDFDMLINDYNVYAYIGPNDLPGAPFVISGFQDTGVPDGFGGTIVTPIETPNADNTQFSAFNAAKQKEYTPISLDDVLRGLTSVQVVPNQGAFGAPTALGAYPNSYDYDTLLRQFVFFSHSGEPVCELAGRAAITIRDEASKLNLNVAGAFNYNPLTNLIERSVGLGATTAELETRNLPDTDLIQAAKMWSYRVGAPDGRLGFPGYDLDISLPGYGRVDDNANALISSFNGRDDDGDGLVDEGLFLPEVSAMAQRSLAGTPLPGDNLAAVNDELDRVNYFDYFDQLGAFEGVDESGELQRFRPLRNLIADGNNPYQLPPPPPPADLVDNDGDGAINEFGELGDLQLQDALQIGEVNNIGFGETRDRILQAAGAFSTDRNASFVLGQDGIQAVNKLDYNFATPTQIAANLLLANPFQSVTARKVSIDPSANRFAEGLRQGDLHIRSATTGLMWVDPTAPTPTVSYIGADPVLRAMQVAADIVDNRDTDHIRSTLTSEKNWQGSNPPGAFDYFPTATDLLMRERITEGNLLPLSEIQDHLRNHMAINRKLEIRDDWWSAGVDGANGNDEVRHISYTATGNEAIKINEMMVRAVRRVEAEAIPDDTLVGADDPMVDVTLANFNYFDPTPEGDKIVPVGGTPEVTVLPDFTMTRQTLANSRWALNGGVHLGDSSVLTTNGLNISEGVELGGVEDVIQFMVFPTNPNDHAPLNPNVLLPQPDGLPSGRYYLTVRASVNGQPIAGNQIEYSIKYVNLDPGVATPTIIDDIQAAAAAGASNAIHFPERWISVPAQHVASGIGEPLAWAFINGTPPLNLPFLGPNNNYFLDGGLDHLAPSTGLPEGTYTVSVPEFTATDPDGDGIPQQLVDLNNDGLPDKALCIAFRLSPLMGDGDVLSIDALDFSQEPDHEWLELVNSSDEEVNIGGWNLEVGIPDKPGIPRDPFKNRWRIPDSTTVAPGGTVLLSFNKYDHYRALGGVSQLNEAADRVSDNGMGLAVGGFLPHTANLTDTFATVPDIRDTSSSFDPAYVPAGIARDLTGSVFRRFVDGGGNFLDYIDRDGDGLSSMYSSFPDSDTDASQIEAAVRSTRELGSAVTAGIDNLPWDRIVQLECLQYATVDPTQVASATVTFDQIVTVDDVARMVLKGGVFPNYPEQDGYDNDGDGGYVTFDGTTPVYNTGILDRDMVDNDLNGYIDERGTVQDLDLDDDIDYFGLAANQPGDGVNQFLSEGVDEGFGVGAGMYLLGTLDLRFYADRSQYPTDVNYDDFSGPTPVFSLFENLLDGSVGIDAASVPPALIRNLDETADPYIGSRFDPPTWKAFVERRWYPGDNVIVTLYTSEISEETVVDRVTYREQDVTNRTIDDVVSWPYATALGAVPWNAEHQTIWPPNHMGLDFYRSLERKHPFYNGDRFGTTNRWEATDGNYDDWADSLSFYEEELAGTGNPLLVDTTQSFAVRSRFPGPGPITPVQIQNLRLFGHAMWGTPLRMNSAARISENPADLYRIATLPLDQDRRQFPGPLDYFRTQEDGGFDGSEAPLNGIRVALDITQAGTVSNNSKSLPNQSWNHSKAVIANRPYSSPGDLMRVPHQIMLQDAFKTPPGRVDSSPMLNYTLSGGTRQDIALRGASLGQDTVDDPFSRNMLTAAIGSMALESVVLTVGQAEMRPLLPDAAAIQTDTDLLRWMPNSPSNPNDLLAPAAWSPVFLFGLDRDTDPNVREDHLPNYPAFVNGSTAGPIQFDLNYLFNRQYLSDVGNFRNGIDVYNNNLNDRWPLEKRVAMYVSENRTTSPDAAEALFTWDGEDGLENGEYVLYVGTYVPGMREQVEEAARNVAGVVDSAATGAVGKSSRNLLPTTDPATGVTTTLLMEDGTTLTLPNGTPVDVSPVTRSVLERDPSSPKRINRHFDPVLALDVITDPTEARGEAPPASGPSKPAGLIAPGDWDPVVRYRPGNNGYIFYGANAVGGWKPHIVRVTDNFLALRVRNLGEPGEVAVITHIVLAPRKRTVGRVNVNTALNRVIKNEAPITTTDQYASPLLSLPGVVDVARTIQPTSAALPLATNPIAVIPQFIYSYASPAPAAQTSPSAYLSQFGLAALSPVPNRNYYDELSTTDSDLLAPLGLANNTEEHAVGAYRLNAGLLAGRTEFPDGRYYTSIGALASDSSGFDFGFTPALRGDVPDLSTGTPGVDSRAIYPLSNESEPSKRFEEIRARFGRIGNLVTVRSDIFEILMTVESGYGVDRNSDGFINYRDPNEFVTTGASKASATYERRAPSDTTDAGE